MKEKQLNNEQVRAQLAAAGVDFLSENRVRMPLRVLLRKVIRPGTEGVSLEKPWGAAPAAAEEFVIATFRALSESQFTAELNGGGLLALLDFTEPGVLKAAAGMLTGQVVYPDHLHQVDAWLGTVVRDWWSETDPGLPPGLNVELKIDALSNPKIARGLLLEPPAVKAGSVCMEFEMRRSHPDLEDWEFWELQGQNLNGAVVRCIVVRIERINEYSLCWDGADPFAKKLPGPQAPALTRAAQADARLTRPGHDPGKEDENMIAELLKRTQALLGRAAPAGLEAKTEAEALELVLVAAEKDRTELERVRSEAELGAKLVATERAEVTRLAKLVECAKPDAELPPAIKKAVELMTVEELAAAKADYGKRADAKLPFRCVACGSANIERRSSVEQPPEEPAAAGFTPTPAGRSLFGSPAKGK
jgi:hypothetical protein